MTEKNMKPKIYEIRQNGKTLCTSSLKDCGYAPAILKGMAKVGQFLYCSGKRVK